jgi:hypothetical protein
MSDHKHQAAHHRAHHAGAKGGVLNITGSFQNPWKDPAEEAKAIAAWDWGAATDTFRSVYGSSTITVSSFSKFLGVIQKQPVGSITRINLISHANTGLISFAGHVLKPTGNSEHRVTLDGHTAITTKVLMDTEPRMEHGHLVDTLGGMAINLRDRFAKGAEIDLYLCNSGADLEVVQTLANSLQVTVKGFSSEIWYRPDVTQIGHHRVRIDRRYMSREDNSIAKPGVSHLNPDIIRTPRPDPPAKQ